MLKKKRLRDVVPTQSSHRSCSRENDTSDGESVTAPLGAMKGIETFKARLVEKMQQRATSEVGAIGGSGCHL